MDQRRVITYYFIFVTFLVSSVILLSGCSSDSTNDQTAKKTEKKEEVDPFAGNHPVKISARFVNQVTKGQDYAGAQKKLEALTEQELMQELDTDEEKLAFWINVYNGYSQHFLKSDPALYKNDRSDFFSKEQVPVGGYTLSLEDIEHGALREGSTKWSAGYIRLPNRNDFVKNHKVSKTDERIHFALNCGAAGCPPVAVYTADKVNQQLNQAMVDMLQNEVKIDHEEEIVYVPAYMKWFQADFEGERGMRDLLKEVNMIEESNNYNIKAKEYDWNLQVDNYTTYS